MSSGSSENPLSSSLTDMMTSLMVIFILLLVVYLKDDQTAKAEKEKAQIQVIETIDELKVSLDEMAKKLAATKPKLPPIKIEKIGKRTLVIIVPEIPGGGQLFEVGRPEPTKDLSDIMTELADGMLENIVGKSEVRALIQSVTIEGHTDRKQYKDADGKEKPFENLFLSQGRAREILEIFLEQAAIERDNGKGIDPELAAGVKRLFAASGRAEWDCGPLEPDIKCRNVVIKIRGISSDDLEEAQSEPIGAEGKS
jgi:flagellar motor protein MotB